MKYDSLKYLISAYHEINSNLVNKSIEIEIYNKEKINLVLNNRMIKLFKNLDISIIEIKESDRINNTEIISDQSELICYHKFRSKAGFITNKILFDNIIV
jgi:hypothetical protein